MLEAIKNSEEDLIVNGVYNMLRNRIVCPIEVDIRDHNIKYYLFVKQKEDMEGGIHFFYNEVGELVFFQKDSAFPDSSRIFSFLPKALNE